MVLILTLVALAIAWWAVARVLQQGAAIDRLRERLDAIEREAGRGGALTAVPPPDEPAAIPPLPTPIPIHDQAALEQMIGGVWLQNAGAVLVLVGTFFLILWGYTTGHVGPGVLVAAGVALGFALAWRGDRLARSVPKLGHALIGVGTGVVYLALYLGHFTLRVLELRVALLLLAATSMGAVAVGLRYKEQTIAVLGVIGAFLPQLLAGVLELRGFSIGPAGRLAYTAVVDSLVFALAVRAGWGSLNLAALLMTTLLWVGGADSTSWGWGIRIGLSVLFAAFGLALLPRLVAVPGRVRPAEIAVVALAPLCYLAVAWPFIAYMAPAAAGSLLLVQAAVYLAAALWVEPRREDEDLWRPLTGAATLYLTAAVQRAVGLENTPMAWCVEGALLVWVGLSRRGAWLRFCGYVVSALGAVLVMGALVSDMGWRRDAIPLFHPGGLRNLVSFVALTAGALALARRRPELPAPERIVSRVWTAGLNLLLLWWTALESWHLAESLHATGGRWARPPALGAAPPMERMRTVAAVATSAAWAVQAATLLVVGWAIGSAFARWLALSVIGLTVLKLVAFDLQRVDAFWRFLTAIAIGTALLAVSYFYQRRARKRA